MKDGFYWLTSERSSNPSICQKFGNRFYLMNETGWVHIEELNRRGWELGKRIRLPYS